MTAETPECCTKILTKLGSVHEDLVEITQKRDLNIISSPLSENGAVLLGFPGSGLVGTIALQYLVDQLNFEQIGSMNSRYFPPLAMMNKGLINDPVRIYAKNIGDTPITAIVADIPIAPPICYEIASALIGWLEPFKPKEVLTIAGIVTNEPEKRVFGVATTPEALQRIQDNTLVLPIGSISGIASSLLTECKARTIPAIGLLGETINAPDPRAAAATIDVLNKMYNLALDIQPLIEQAVEIEQTMGKLAEEVQQSADTTPKKDLPMYG
ncbi:proteasome assembly chaperone family protein [Methanoregula sp.]|uniref:proteasome assembly chaperone family protein n=1 Tax=Methanoregula sp. TaxID=2052170 RepID=UPI00236AE199|nr:proteasome assembly chaperone family protein [Methanoregula sp.]MDD1685464.1 proteasome assembly chaperone family protein [Methanoregula sp.]